MKMHDLCLSHGDARIKKNARLLGRVEKCNKLVLIIIIFKCFSSKPITILSKRRMLHGIVINHISMTVIYGASTVYG